MPDRRLVLLLAAAAGLAVAPLYAQPMLGALPDLGASARAIGFVPTLTQLGYALGILLLAPLGDRFDRRRVIVTKAATLVVALLLAAIAPSLGLLLAASFAIGLAATMAQDVVPAAATLAHDAHRGRIVGTVMTGCCSASCCRGSWPDSSPKRPAGARCSRSRPSASP